MSKNAVIRLIAQGIHAKVYVELGCQGGGNINCLTKVVKGRLIGVDRNDHTATIKEPIEFVHMTTDEYYEKVKGTDLVIDLLFIDATHSYEQVKKDFDNFSSLVRDQGMIVIHDTYPPTISHLSPGACSNGWQFAEELRTLPEYRKDFEICTLPFGCGITIIRKTKFQLPPTLDHAKSKSIPKIEVKTPAQAEILKRATHPQGGWRDFYQPVWGLPEIRSYSKKPSFDARMEFIIAHADPTKKFFLGGANIGYSAFYLATKGATMTCVERAAFEYEFSVLLAEHNGFSKENPNFNKGDILEYLKTTTGTYDYAILLMVLHHMWKKDEGEAFEVLNLLVDKGATTIFVQCRPKDWLPKNIPEYIVEHTNLKGWEQISSGKKHTHGNIPVYKLYA